MNKSTLIPFLREDLDILFVGLNPARGSSNNGHYFSVNQAFWNQLYLSGLIVQQVNKSNADEIVFGTNSVNYKNKLFGITDLEINIAESNSSIVPISTSNYENLMTVLIKNKPKIVILLHGKVLAGLLSYLGYKIPRSNSGLLGRLIEGQNTMFYNIAFPHGNTIKSEEKIKNYKEVLKYLANENHT